MKKTNGVTEISKDLKSLMKVQKVCNNIFLTRKYNGFAPHSDYFRIISKIKCWVLGSLNHSVFYGTPKAFSF